MAFRTLLMHLCLVGSLGLSFEVSASKARAQSVGLELVLLIDVSASVNAQEYNLQTRGLAAAFASQPVRDAIARATSGVAITVIQWADKDNQETSVDWTLVAGDSDALWLADRLASMRRLIPGGHTALGNALEAGLAALETNAYDGVRRVIDLSGDGRSNDGLPLRSTREEVLSRGITVNGLAILNELPLLEDYFRDHLIGGEGAFVMTASDYEDFARAIREKIAREIEASPLTYRQDVRRYASRAGDGLIIERDSF